jgi:phage FluMu protein Com
MGGVGRYPLGMVIQMTETNPPEGKFDIVCPHCHKEFRGEVIAGDSERHMGFKCPHCKLIVAYDRAEPPAAA